MQPSPAQWRTADGITFEKSHHWVTTGAGRTGVSNLSSRPLVGHETTTRNVGFATVKGLIPSSVTIFISRTRRRIAMVATTAMADKTTVLALVSFEESRLQREALIAHLQFLPRTMVTATRMTTFLSQNPLLLRTDVSIGELRILFQQGPTVKCKTMMFLFAHLNEHWVGLQQPEFVG